jgi:HupE / UreJ protein
VLNGPAGPLMLDPRWHQAAWMFVKSGIHHILGGVDHLLFLLCLVLPFRRLDWNLVGVITAFTVAHSITLVCAAFGLVPAALWFPPLVETLIAASIIYMALENVFAPNLMRRWLVTAIFGLVHGFGFSFALGEELQLAGSHLVLSLLTFNVGIEIGQILFVAALLPLLAWLGRRPRAERTISLGVCAGVGLIAAYWLVERLQELARVPAVDGELALGAGHVLSVLLILGGAACWYVGRRARRR